MPDEIPQRETEEGRDPHFPLTKYFVATGLVTAVAVAGALAAVSAAEVRDDLLHKSQDSAVLLVRNLNLQVHQRFIAPTIEAEGSVDLEEPEQLRALDEVVRLAIAEHGIRAVYFFDLEGRIIYSTNPEHRGLRISQNSNYDQAVEGQVSSRLVARGDPLDVSGEGQEVSLLETYVPIESLAADGTSTGRRVGVIEVYQDASPLLEESRRASYRVAAISTIGILALMLALWLWIRKAERSIDERDKALVAANDQLAALSADLEQQVQDRTRRLVRAETLASVGTLSAGVAHEVNNPVAAIASCAEGLLRRAKAESLNDVPEFADFPEYLGIIRDEAFRVKEITRNLLDFSRSESPTRSEPVDLGQLLEAAARLVGHRLRQEEKELALDLPPEPVVVPGDGAGLRQLILNVTVNAIDAAPAGGTIRWTLRPLEEGAELSCEDDGPGFSPTELERALEPFFTRKEAGRGTGLGLSIAYGVARQHGGSLELGNRGAGGAAVVVRLRGAPDG